MSRAVRIAAIGHCSALGLTLREAADSACRDGDSAASERTILGRPWPWFGMALADDCPEQRAREAIGRVGNELAATLSATEWSETPLFIASSSLQMGALEASTRELGSVVLPPDAAAFSQQVADWLDIAGTPWTFSTTCTSGLAALDAAATLIRSGELERALVLAIELANDTTMAGFAGLGLLASSPGEAGLVLGEAVAGVLLTATPGPGWHIAACRLGIDGHSPTGPSPDGKVISAVIRSALADAGLPPAAIDLLKPHGGGIDATAAAEVCALEAVFGAALPPRTDFKGRLGHTLGASGLVELGLLVSALDRAPDTAQHALCNLIGFGGSIATVILSRDGPRLTTAAGDHRAVKQTARIALELDGSELNRRARSALGGPVRRAGTLAELCLAGVDACLSADEPEQAPPRSTAVLYASRSGPRAAFQRVLEDLCLREEDPMPFDFLATQAILAALHLKKRMPGLETACYLPLGGDTGLQWQRMLALARAWLTCGRHGRVLLGMVEPGDEMHCCEWRCLTLGFPET